MIKINLLPEELKKKRQFNTYVLVLLGIGVGLLSIIIVVSLVLGVQVKFQTTRLKRLSEEWKVIKKEEREVLGLESLKAELDKKKKAIENLAQSRLLWSRKLYQLSRQVLPSIYLTNLDIGVKSEKIKVTEEPTTTTRRRKATAAKVKWATRKFETLVLKGIVISLAGEEMIDSVGKFMTSLEQDEEFFEDFSDIELVFTQRKPIEGIETMSFELGCRFK